MSIKGFNINGQIQKYDYNALDNKPNVSGLSDQAKEALLNLFQHTAYVNADGQTYYQALYEAFYPRAVYSVTNTLTGCTTTNSASFIMDGSIYEATIVAATGYTLTGATVNITMGGESVTGVYNNGSINIPNVTGDLVITVTAASSVTSISAVFTQGQNVITNVDSLDSLRQYLVVTATYADSTTGVISGYTLSGTLAIGTDTITVTYGGKTDTFTVTVSDSGYLYYWDFTDSLVDRVAGREAELYNLSGRTSNGVHFALDSRIDTDDWNYAIRLGNVFGYNKVVEVDLANVLLTKTGTRAVISLSAGAASVTPSTSYNVFGYHYSTNTENDRYGIVASNVEHWSYNANTSVGTNTYLDGASCTVKFQVDSNGVMSVFKNGVDLNAVYPVSASGSRPTISEENASYMNIGSYTKYESTAGEVFGYSGIVNADIRAVRIYNLGV